MDSAHPVRVIRQYTRPRFVHGNIEETVEQRIEQVHDAFDVFGVHGWKCSVGSAESRSFSFTLVGTNVRPGALWANDTPLVNPGNNRRIARVYGRASIQQRKRQSEPAVVPETAEESIHVIEAGCPTPCRRSVRREIVARISHG